MDMLGSKGGCIVSDVNGSRDSSAKSEEEAAIIELTYMSSPLIAENLLPIGLGRLCSVPARGDLILKNHPLKRFLKWNEPSQISYGHYLFEHAYHK
jgi:hypothetical protein